MAVRDLIDISERIVIERWLRSPDTIQLTIDAKYAAEITRGKFLYLPLVDISTPLAFRITAIERDKKPGSHKLVVHGVTLDGLALGGRLCWPDPANYPADTAGYDTQTAVPAETAFKHYVDVNAGPSAVADRRIPGLAIVTDSARGADVNTAARYQSVLDLGKEICFTADIGWKMTYEAGTDTHNFDIIEPVDRSASVFLDFEYGTISEWAEVETDAQGSLVVVAGQGEGAARELVIRPAVEPTGLARIESFRDARDVALGETAVLEQRGDAVLAAAGATRSVTVVAEQSGSFEYPTDYGLGDYVTARDRERDLSEVKQIVGVRFTVQGPGSAAVPKIEPILDRPDPTSSAVTSFSGGKVDLAAGVPADITALQAKLGSGVSAPLRGDKLSGTGGGASVWHRNGHYDLREWGTIPDYAAGGAAALLQAAIDEVTTLGYEADGRPGNDEWVEGGTIHLPVGYIWLGARVNMKRHVAIEGALKPQSRGTGKGAYYSRVKMMEGVNAGAFYIPMAAEGVRLSNFALNGNKATQAGTQHGIETQYLPATMGATGVASTNLFTSTGHGLVEGDRVYFSALTGGAGLSINTNYYVIASGLTANDFKVSATKGGAEIDFTTDVSAATINNWLGNVKGGDVYENLLIEYFTGWGIKTSPYHLALDLSDLVVMKNDIGGIYVACTDATLTRVRAAYNTQKGIWLAGANLYVDTAIVWGTGKNGDSGALTAGGIGLYIDGDAAGFNTNPEDMSIVNSFIEQSTADGVFLGDRAQGIRFTNTSFRKNSTNGNDAGSHVLCDSDVDRANSFTDCRFEDDDNHVTYDFEITGTGAIFAAANDHSQGGWRTARVNNPSQLMTQIASSTNRITHFGAVNIGATTFPAVKSTNDRVYRTDLKMEFVWDGTRWLSTQLFTDKFFATTISATGVNYSEHPAPESLDKWLESIYVTAAVVAGGTALDASNKWVLSLTKYGTGDAGANINANVLTLDSGVSDGTFRTPVSTAISALLGTTYSGLRAVWTKTGTPGGLNGIVAVGYRLVGT